MTTFFTSDTHFGHKNLITRHHLRPFASVEEMDEALIANWNARVGPDDDVWHLGDFCFRNAKSPAHYLRRLNGHKHLVWGNHDPDQLRAMPLWTSSQAYAEIFIGKQRVVLLHYAMRVWNQWRRGSIHLFGHSHGNLDCTRRSLDVGTDCWNYTPVTFEEILERLETMPESHHLPIVRGPAEED